MKICSECRREVKVGQRVIRNYVLTETSELKDVNYQHANCYDAEGPRYDESMEVIVEKYGYIKPPNTGEIPEDSVAEDQSTFHPALGYHYER